MKSIEKPEVKKMDWKKKKSKNKSSNTADSSNIIHVKSKVRYSLRNPQLITEYKKNNNNNKGNCRTLVCSSFLRWSFHNNFPISYRRLRQSVLTQSAIVLMCNKLRVSQLEVNLSLTNLKIFFIFHQNYHGHIYIIGHYKPSVRIIVLVSNTTYVVCVIFIHKWRDLQF